MANPAKGDFEKYAETGFYITADDAEAAKRTVYMDSNIALTDGSAPIGSGTVKTIPNLYKAIHDMDTRIDAISKYFAISTADAGLHIKPLVGDGSKAQYAHFLRDSRTDRMGVEISVGDGFDNTGVIKKNAVNSQPLTDYNMHFRANEITFTVSNPNQIITEAYAITEPDLINIDTEGKVSIDTSKVRLDGTAQTMAENLILLHNAINTATNESALKNAVSMVYYWVPLEDDDAAHGKINITEASGIIRKDLRGKIFIHIDVDNEIALENATGNDIQYAQLVRGILNKNGTIVYAGHAVVVSETGLNVNAALTGDDKLKVIGEMTYNLCSIIEAIHELNRRTMFMDTDTSFNGTFL